MRPRIYKITPLPAWSLLALLVLFALLGCLLWAGKADAEWGPGSYGPGRPFGEAELAAMANAEAYWGQQPALCTSRTMEVVAPGALNVGGIASGRATQPTEPAPCTMWLDEAVVDDWPLLCTVVRHEYGHWLGLSHSDKGLAQMEPCFDRIEALRWRHILTWGRCEEMRQGTERGRRCWARSRSTLRELEVAVGSQAA